MSPAQDLDIWFLLECWGLYLTLRFLLVWVASWEKSRPCPSFFKDALSTSPFDLVSEASLLSKGGSSVYVIFDRTMKNLTKIKVFRSYSWGEYIFAAFRTLLASTHFTYKALSQRSCLYTPQQNGVAERTPYIGDSSLSLALSFCPQSIFGWSSSDCRIFFESNTFLCHLWSLSFWKKIFYPAWLWRASSLSGEDVVVTPAASSRAGRPAV